MGFYSRGTVKVLILLLHGAPSVGKTSTAGDMNTRSHHDMLLKVYRMCCGPVSEAVVSNYLR